MSRTNHPRPSRHLNIGTLNRADRRTAKSDPRRPRPAAAPTAATAWDSWAAGSLDHRPGAYDDVQGIGPKTENVPAKPARSKRP